MNTDFRESGFMYGLAAFVVLFVIGQSLFFIIKAWKRGKELGIDTQKLKNTVISSSLFTIAPAIAILATVIVLANSLGLVLPWIRLSVIGNLAYETVAAQSTLEALGGNITTAITDPKDLSAVAWVMTVGTGFAPFLCIFFCKKIQKKLGTVINKNEKTNKLADIISAAAFIGIIAAFTARSINGKTADGSGDAGFMSIAVLLSAIFLMLLLDFIIKKTKLLKLEPFIMPFSMFGAMGVAILLSQILPGQIANFTWWG